MFRKTSSYAFFAKGTVKILNLVLKFKRAGLGMPGLIIALIIGLLSMIFLAFTNHEAGIQFDIDKIDVLLCTLYQAC